MLTNGERVNNLWGSFTWERWRLRSLEELHAGVLLEQSTTTGVLAAGRSPQGAPGRAGQASWDPPSRARARTGEAPPRAGHGDVLGNEQCREHPWEKAGLADA